MPILDGWRFCPRCGSGLEPDGHGHLGCGACGSAYYANSAPAVQGLLVRDGRVLLARRAIEPRRGHWDLPGGFLEEGEEPVEGLKREFREETGLEVEPVEWLGAFIDPYAHQSVLSLNWIVAGDGEPVAADDVESLEWFAPADLPGELAFPSQEIVLPLWARRESEAGR